MGTAEKIASHLMQKNKTTFIKSLRSLFGVAVIKDSLTGREFQYFSLH